MAARQQAGDLMRQVRAALAAGQTRQAESLYRQLEAMQMPDNAFAAGQDRPGLVFQALQQAIAREVSGGVRLANGIEQPNPRGEPLVYYPSQAPGGVRPIADLAPIPSPSNLSPGYTLFQQGEAALKNHDGDRALQLFQQASAYSNDLDPTTAARLQDHLSLLSVPRAAPPRTAAAGAALSPADADLAAQQALLKQVYDDVNYRQAEAKRTAEKDPQAALAMLQEARKKVEESAGLDPAAREQLLRRLDRSIADAQRFIEQNRSLIDLNEKNNAVRRELDRDANAKLQTQQKLVVLVNQYNRLIDEQRFEEAEAVGKQALQLAPHEMVAQMMVTKISILIKLDRERRIQASKADHVADEFNRVDGSSDPGTGTGEPYIFPDPKDWKAITGRRARTAMELNRRHRSEKEMEIEKKLKTPVHYSCHGRALSEVLSQLAKLVNINIHLDDEGLRVEGLSPDTPVTLELTSDIMLKSCLDLILEKNHLCYIVKNEVLNVTSDSKKAEDVQVVVYPVGDLVVPIPNFVAGPHMGLAGALRDAMANAVGGGSGFGTPSTPMAVASRDGKQNMNAVINPALLANMAPRLPGGTAAGPGGAAAGPPPISTCSST